jgi:hypothetical protein
VGPVGFASRYRSGLDRSVSRGRIRYASRATACQRDSMTIPEDDSRRADRIRLDVQRAVSNFVIQAPPRAVALGEPSRPRH